MDNSDNAIINFCRFIVVLLAQTKVIMISQKNVFIKANFTCSSTIENLDNDLFVISLNNIFVGLAHLKIFKKISITVTNF